MALLSSSNFACLSFVFGFFSLCSLPAVARSETFLAHSPGIQEQLLLQINGLFGQGASDGRVERLEARMRPMYQALPKDSNNQLAQQAARYALHRYFASFHGWNIEGLSPRGNLTNAPVIALDGRAPLAIKDMVEGRFQKQGFSLRDLATLASMLELLVRAEVVERLTEAYHSMGLQILDSIDKATAEDVIAWHFMISWLAADGVEGDAVEEYKATMDQIYPGWLDTVTFISDMRKNVDFGDRHATNPFVARRRTFDDVVRLTEAVNDKFGQFQNFECRKLKDMLLEREYRGTGRIRLADFYGLALAGEWRFSEKAEYLRDLGILDEADTQNPTVIITNYLQGASNCLGASNFYSVCCLDECEGLLGHLEEKFAAPDASAEDILSVVSGLPSSTVVAPRNLSTQLKNRLREVASFHGGRVPLHGRLFAQWMHHAYPRECPFPHVSGTTEKVTPNDWVAQKAKEAGLPVDEVSAGLMVEELEMYVYSNRRTSAAHSASHYDDEFGDEHPPHDHDAQQQEQLPHLYMRNEPGAWSEEEELFAGSSLGQRWAPWQMPSGQGAKALLRNCAMFVALTVVFSQFLQLAPVSCRSKGHGATKDYVV